MSDNCELRQWKFFGRVLPESVAATMTLNSFEGESEGGLRYKLSGRIHSSQVLIDVKVYPHDMDIYTLRNSVESAVRQHVDLIGFARGLSLDVEIISASSADGAREIFGAEIPHSTTILLRSSLN